MDAELQAELAQVLAIRELCHERVNSSTPRHSRASNALPSRSSSTCCVTLRPASRSCCRRPSAVSAARVHAQRRRQASYPELVFGAIKKSGKTTLAAIIMLTMILLYGGRFAEGYCVANDYGQAASRVFAIVKRIVEASPLLRGIAKLTATGSPSQRSAPPSSRSHPTQPAPPGPTQRLPASTNSGGTYQHQVGDCGTK